MRKIPVTAEHDHLAAGHRSIRLSSSVMSSSRLCPARKLVPVGGTRRNLRDSSQPIGGWEEAKSLPFYHCPSHFVPCSSVPEESYKRGWHLFPLEHTGLASLLPPLRYTPLPTPFPSLRYSQDPHCVRSPTVAPLPSASIASLRSTPHGFATGPPCYTPGRNQRT